MQDGILRNADKIAWLCEPKTQTDSAQKRKGQTSMSINFTSPANLLVKSMTSGIWSYEFFKNIKMFQDAELLGNTPDSVFQLDYRSLEPYEGEFSDSLVLKPITSLESQRDYVNGGNTPTILTMTGRNDNGVFVRRKLGPVNLGEDAGVVSICSKERLVQHFAEQCALEAKAFISKLFLGVARAAISNMTGAAHTKNVYNASYNAANNITTPYMAQARGLLGDKANENIGNGKGVWVMTSYQEADLIGSQITANYFPITGEVIKTASPMTLGGKYISYDDSPTLTSGGTTAQGQAINYCMGFGKNFGRVRVSEPRFYVTDQRVEYESVANLLRADYDVEVTINGFGFDKSGGGANPTYATATTASNWVVNYSDHREVHGVILETNTSTTV